MKYYIFLTEDIHPIGGMQNYVAGKTKYLLENNWDVHIFFNGPSYGKCSISYLDSYVDGGIPELANSPFFWSKSISRAILMDMINRLGIIGEKNEEILIESHNDGMSLWGELLAPMIHAKHYCFICNESFTGSKKHYREYIDFFNFKHIRHELTAISPKSIPRLFDGYKVVPESEVYVFYAKPDNITNFVPDFDISSLSLAEWNICYIGRAKKGYVPSIIKDVAKFANQYPSHNISFTMIGDMSIHSELIQNELHNINNLTLNLLGDMVPIPKQIFDVVDVIIAGAGCATCSIENHIPTIIPDAKNYKSNGLWGKTTHNVFYAEDPTLQTNFCDSLSEFFVENSFNKETIVWPNSENETAQDVYSKHFDFIYSYNAPTEYYTFENYSYNNIINKKKIKYILEHKFQPLYKFYRCVKKWVREET